MGKALVIQDANFLSNAIYRGGRFIYENNNFTWGKGGITSAGTSSGSTNATMSMIGLPLEQASDELVFVGANGYQIRALLTSDYPSPGTNQYVYETYDIHPQAITIPSGKYYQISVTRTDLQNADLSDGPSALLLRQEVS